MGTSKIAKAASTGKLSVVFDANCRQPICANAERFNNEIGFIIRNHGTFSYKDWRLVPEEVRAPLRSYLLIIFLRQLITCENFDINLSDETTKECIDDQMRKAWKGFKYKLLHLYFKQIGGGNDIDMAKKKRHPDLKDDQQKDWGFLCERWCSEHFKERAKKNINNRSKRKWGSKNGSVSTARYHIRRGMALTSSTGQIETWRLQHFDKNNGWLVPDLKDIYDDMMTLRETYTAEERSDKKIMECVLGRHSVYLRGWGRSSDTTNSASHRVSAEPNQPSYQELLQQFKDASTRLDEVVNILRQNNLMPQTSTANEVSEVDAHSASIE
ncbi:hypothetical protein DCAR_0519892 [Daucus carota subsp. sativus]|uniref:Uncharacterized protein n=1 Tax=Daucus carota subsp. sativus TaxID=79200 RepID=A0AAF0X675_DAUCS|nr:hypothetical protein DCAR_0519892 [Daucus carota subsp. sativus]